MGTNGLNLQMILTHTLLSTNGSITVELQLLQLQKHLKVFSNMAIVKDLAKFREKRLPRNLVSDLQEDFAK